MARALSGKARMLGTIAPTKEGISTSSEAIAPKAGCCLPRALDDVES
jgi:hypothetical protein